MDLLNKAKNMASGNKGSSTGTTSTGGGAAGGQDYGDKAFTAAGDKFGYKGNAQTNEKITDSARDFIEKKTGKDIPDKFSN